MTGSSDLALRELETDEVVGSGGKADETVVDLSKSSKVEESSKVRKTSKAWKVAKIIGSEERLPKHRSSVNLIQRTRAPVRTLTVFQALFAGPRSSLDIIFESITTRQSEWSCWCSVAFFPREARKIFEPRTLESFTSCNQRSLCTKVCLQNARLPFATSALGYTLGTSISRQLENLLRTSSFHCFKFWRCAPEEDVLTQDQLDSWEDVEGVVHH